MPTPRAAPQPEPAGLAARRIAADLLEGVLRRGRPLDPQLDGAAKHLHELEKDVEGQGI